MSWTGQNLQKTTEDPADRGDQLVSKASVQWRTLSTEKERDWVGKLPRLTADGVRTSETKSQQGAAANFNSSHGNLRVASIKLIKALKKLF